MPPVDLTPLYPALTTAGSALAGVLLTLFIQSTVSARQRRHERQGRAFDLRFELYAELLQLVESISKLRKDASGHITLLQQSVDLMKEIKAANEKISVLYSQLPESGKLADLSADAREEFRTQAKSVLQQKKDSEEALVAAEKIMEQKSYQSAEVQRRLNDYVDNMYLVRQKMRILSSVQTMVAAVALFERVAAEQEPTTAESVDFRHAVQKELGLDQRSRPRRLLDWCGRRFRRDRPARPTT